MSIEHITTGRLILVPFTLKTATSILEGDLKELERMGLQVTAFWPDQEALDTLPKIIRNLELVGEPTGFKSWMVVLRSNRTVIGDAGFKGKPGAAGEVDLGYAIIEQEQWKGYGMEVAKALADWVLLQEGVRCITAKCLLGNTGSARILEKIGMRETYRDDEMIHWEIIAAQPLLSSCLAG